MQSVTTVRQKFEQNFNDFFELDDDGLRKISDADLAKQVDGLCSNVDELKVVLELLDGDVASLTAMEKQINRARVARQNLIKQLKGSFKDNLTAKGVTELAGHSWVGKLSNNVGSLVNNKKLSPCKDLHAAYPDFIERKYQWVSSSKLKQAIKDGKLPEGLEPNFTLVPGVSLNWRPRVGVAK